MSFTAPFADGARQKRPGGMAAFTIVWAGQIVSLLGTAMSHFGLTLWAYQVTGRATPLAMLTFSFMVPMIVLGPFVGVLVDRGNRKLMMALSDLAAALTTLLVLVLYATGGLRIWHLYVTATISGIFQGFQWPAYSAAITLMLPKEQYGRANGMLQLAGDASSVFAPLLAGALIGPLGLTGLLALDLASAAIAVGALLFVHIPQPTPTEAGKEARGSLLSEAAYGFRFIRARPGLLGLQALFMAANFFASLAFSVLAPMLLARTGNDGLIFGTVQSVGAAGGLAGGLTMGAWGGPKKRIHGILVGWVWLGLLGQLVLGLGRTLPVWAVGIFLMSFIRPILNGSSQALWQAKVAPDVQGRVFTTRRLIAWLVMPVSQALSGPLSDRVLEPAMTGDGVLVRALGGLVGTGPGSGIALLFVAGGVLVALAGLSGYLFPAVRNVEARLPDHGAGATA